MTISLENLADGSVSDRNFLKLAQLVVDAGGQSVGIRFGSATLTWTGGSPFATGNVTHGLGRTPAVVLLCDNGGGSLGQLAVFAQNGVGATTFSAAAEPTDSSSPANGTTRGFNWLVIG